MQSRKEKLPISAAAAAARVSKPHSQPCGDPSPCSHPRTGSTGREELCVSSRSLSLWATLRGVDSALMHSAKDEGQKPAFLPRGWQKISLFPTGAIYCELVPVQRSGAARPRENGDEGGDPGADGCSAAARVSLASVAGGAWCDTRSCSPELWALAISPSESVHLPVPNWSHS